MNDTAAAAILDPHDVAAWAQQPFEVLFSLSLADVEELQRQALVRRFEAMRPAIAALDKLAARQGVDRVGTIDDVIPVLFDHRVYKSYPLSLIENRQFGRLTTWLQRLTTHDLSTIPLEGLDSVDDWLTRLDEHGMIIGHSTGTTGKLSFIPRSRVEWPAWKASFFENRRAASGVDTLKDAIPTFVPGYRSGHHMLTKMNYLFARCTAAGEESRHCLYDYALSSDLLSLAGRLQAAEERGEQLRIDPGLLEKRRQLIEASRHRDEDLERWFAKLLEEYRGQRVWIAGTFADLTRLSVRGLDEGVRCDFAPNSVLFGGGGMKGYRDAPPDWRQRVTGFFGIDRICSNYGMSECMGLAPMCDAGFFHFNPYTIPILLDDEANPLPRDGVQTGRLALFDLLAETYWGGFISGDRITMYWDEDCECGWKGPRLDQNIARFAELEGGDDKITCAGTAQAYGEFMDYVSEV